MDKKIAFVLIILSISIGLIDFWGIFMQKPLSVPETSADLNKKMEKIKEALPPFWGGWPANGFMLRVKGGPTVYFSGDTDLMLNWQAIAEYYRPDIVIATHSVLYQMGLEEWTYVINKIRPKYVLASHHGSLPFFPQSDDDFVKAISERTPAQGVKLPEPGQELKLLGLKIIWLGHSSYLIETPKGSRIGFDPEWNANNMEDYPKEFKNPEKYAADLILVSHGHYGHFDPQALDILLTPSKERTPHLGLFFELAAYTKKLLPKHEKRIFPFNLGVWIDKEILENAYGLEMTHLDDIEFAGIFATHSSGVFSPLK